MDNARHQSRTRGYQGIICQTGVQNTTGPTWSVYSNLRSPHGHHTFSRQPQKGCGQSKADPLSAQGTPTLACISKELQSASSSKSDKMDKSHPSRTNMTTPIRSWNVDPSPSRSSWERNSRESAMTASDWTQSPNARFQPNPNTKDNPRNNTCKKTSQTARYHTYQLPYEGGQNLERQSRFLFAVLGGRVAGTSLATLDHSTGNNWRHLPAKHKE